MANISSSRSPKTCHPIPNVQASHIDMGASSSQDLESPTSPTSPLKENMMWKDTLKKSFQKGWPNWPQVKDTKLGSGMKSTVRVNDKVIIKTELPTPKEQFQKAIEYTEDIQGR